MKQGRHHLHCTDEWALVAALRGVFVRNPDDLARKAQARIRGIKAAMPAGLDWSAWMMDVHDATGRHVAYVEFESGLEDEEPASAGTEVAVETGAGTETGAAGEARSVGEREEV